MFASIAGFEFRYQIRQPVFWVSAILFALLSFGLVASDNVSLGTNTSIKENSPYAVMLAAIAFSQFFMFVTTAFVANVVVRDDDTGFAPILRSTRVSKFDYLIGRFTGAYAAAAIAFLSVPLGMLIGTLAPWLDRETLGGFRPGDYLWAYLIFGLVNVFVTSAIFFAVATLTRSMVASFIAVVVFLVINLVVAGAAGQQPSWERPLAYIEPFGGGAFSLVTEYWTTADRNTRLVPFEGVVLWNRLIWIGVGLAFLALAYSLFRFGAKGAKIGKAQRLAKLADVTAAPPPPRLGALPQPRFDGGWAWAQFVARLKLELGQVFRSPALPILLGLGVVFTGFTIWFSGQVFGTATYPTTRGVIQAMSGNFGLVALIIAIYYAGELVWRERDRRMHEIVDASAVPDWAFVVPKTIAVALVLIATLAAAVLTGVVVQALKGYTNFEFDKYLLWFLMPQAIFFVLIAALSVFIQALVPHKFVGWGVMVLYMISNIVLGNLGLSDDLYRYASAPPVPLSDLNGQGDFWKGAAWLRLYWSAFALLLLTIAYGLWRRGTEVRLKPRLKRLPRRLRGPAGAVALAALAVFVGTGVFVYMNTHVWNPFRNSLEGERFSAAYEREFLRYETVPQPAVTNVALNVALYPHEPRLDVRGTYQLVNDTGRPVSELHVRFDRDTEVLAVSMPGARLGREWPRFGYRILRLDQPMAAGERRTLSFTTRVAQRGFRDSGNLTSIVDNGTFINNGDFAPRIGMDRSGIMTDRARRRRYNLPDVRMAPLGDPATLNRNYIGVDWVRSDITVSTVADQTPIAPGYRVSDTVANGRRTARFVSDSPVLNFFSIQSARYAERTQNHNGVQLTVYYHPTHAWNVDRMLAASRAGLDYFQANFSPYQFRQFRIIEFPGYASFAQAFANTIPYSENIGFTSDVNDPDEIDIVTYVTAHELAHQWWAHQVLGADQQGQTVLSETLSQYSALMVMERLYGPDKIRRFLKRELDTYLQNRGAGGIDEQPLMRVENQQYVHYNKGSLVMYLLRDQMGEAAVNRALRRVIADHAFRGPPYPNSLALVRALRAEAGPQQQSLITDLFERITVYDLQARGMTTRRRPDGRWETRLTVEARKRYADGEGVEREANLYETMDIGLFNARPGEGAFSRSNVVAMERRPVRSGVQTFTFVTARQPRFAGVDPYNKWIDRNADDNLAAAG